jgi:hypothetical protein
MFFAGLAGLSVVLAVAWVTIDSLRPVPVLNSPASSSTLRALGAAPSSLLRCWRGGHRTKRGSSRSPAVVVVPDGTDSLFG